jgi:hypothetical protein
MDTTFGGSENRPYVFAPPSVKATNCAIENAPLEAEMTEFCVC